MKIEHIRWQRNRWEPTAPGQLLSAQVVFLFGSPSILKRRYLLQEVQRAYPQAHLLGCSTAGEISQTQVLDDSLVVTAVQFEHTTLRGFCFRSQESPND